VEGGDANALFASVRTVTRSPAAGFGVFYSASPLGTTSTSAAWLFGLKQDNRNRTNVALVNLGDLDNSPSTFLVDVYDGDTGRHVVSQQPFTVNALGWLQVNSLLASFAPGVSQGYVRTTRLGSNSFMTYAVINDGAAPGEPTGDGTFIPSSP